MPEQAKASLFMKSRCVLVAICYLGFISLGIPDALIGVAWPSVRDTFRLQQSHVSWIFIGSGVSYFLSSSFAGRLLTMVNVGVLLAGSSGLVALSGFNYALATVWPWFALGALLHGLGSGAIDAGLNHYVATHFSASHMNWLHASYSLGAMLGPLIMTACIARAGSWRLAYLIVALTLLVLALLFFSTKWKWVDPTPLTHSATAPDDRATPSAGSLHEPPSSPHPPVTQGGSSPLTATKALGNRVVQLQILLFFTYTGLEIALGQWSFTVLTESRGMAAEAAGAWVTLYWGSILAGRIAFGFIVDRITIDRLIRVSMMTALLGAALLAFNPFALSAPLALALCGLGLAVIFPCLMTRTPQRIGRDLATHAIGFQVGAAMLGSAAIPSVCGLVAQHAGLNLVVPTLLGVAAALLLLHELVLHAARHGKPIAL
jgi:fucose permease